MIIEIKITPNKSIIKNDPNLLKSLFVIAPYKAIKPNTPAVTNKDKPKVCKSYITTRGETQIPIAAANNQYTVIAKGLDLVFAITKLPTKDKIITAINPAIKIP